MARRLLPFSLCAAIGLVACAAPAPSGAPAATGGGWFSGVFPQPRAAGDLSGEGAKSFNAPATPAPNASPTAAPSASPVPTASPTAAPALGMAALTCRLYNERGNPVDGGFVRVRSLDADAPFETTVRFSTSGVYHLGRIPTGVPLEVEASRDDGGGDRFTRRSRRVTIPAGSDGTVLQFGTASPAAIVAESADFLSDMPEVEKVELATSPGFGEIRLFLSEPLDAANRTRFATALRIFPANAQADPDVNATDAPRLTDLERQPEQIASYTYFIDEPPTTTNVSTTWNSAGDAVTLIFPLSALRSAQRGAVYQVALVSAGTAIRDIGNDFLGMGDVASGALQLQFGDYQAGGELIFNAFKRDRLGLAVGDLTPEKRWGATHMNSFLFRVEEGNLRAVDPVAYP